MLYRSLWFSVKHQQESAIGTPMSPPSSHPSRLSQSPCLSSRVIEQIPTGYLFYIWYCKFPCYSLHTTPPLPLPSFLPSPHVHGSVLYVCFSRENLFEGIITKILPNLGNETEIQVQETQRVPNKMCTKKSTPRYIMIRMAYVINRQS